MKLRRGGAVNERVADRSEAEAPSPFKRANEGEEVLSSAFKE